MTRPAQLALKYGLPLLILAAGAALAARLIASREEPERKEARDTAVLVRTQTVSRKPHRLNVRASGTVIPARQSRLTPQVSGRLVAVHPNLEVGGIVQKSERLAQVDRSDYRIAVRQRESALEQARAQMQIEKGQRDVAEREWELFKEEFKAPKGQKKLDSSLALREPQLRSARAQVESAKAQLERAKLDLRRTSVEAPFDAFVREETVDVGQLVGTQSSIATLIGTDAYWVRISLQTDKLSHIDIPGVNAEKGAEATIRYDTGDRVVERDGQVLRLLGDLDPAGRMARIIVKIEDPLGLKELDGDPDSVRGMPLLIDAYVEVELAGNTKRKLIEIPRRALRNGDQAWVYADGKLAVRDVKVAWRRPQTVLIDEGLKDGDALIVSPLATPVEGMNLRQASATSGSTASDSPTDPAGASEDTEGGTDE